MARAPFVIAGRTVRAGTREIVSIPVARLYTHTEMTLPVHVVHGRRDGPVLFVSAAVHGDELNGVEVVRRLLALKALTRLRGTLLAVPVVNVYGFLNQSRYLPDRRDLNRSFPGSDKGSLAAQLANLFMTEIVAQAAYGLDLHTGSNHRVNLPQVRANIEHQKTLELARVFGAPVIIDAETRGGSLREAVHDLGIPVLLYEAGEPLRLDEVCIRVGLRGVLNIMRFLKMMEGDARPAPAEPTVVRKSRWIRAPISGMFRPLTRVGRTVSRGDMVGRIVDPVSGAKTAVRSVASGVVIGELRNPLVHRGDAILHIGQHRELEAVDSAIEAFHDEFEPEM